MKLEIDFVSQQGNATRNDCGAACVAMCAGVPVDKVLRAIDHPKDKPLAFGDIGRALVAYRLQHEYIRPLHLPDMRRWLTAGHPIIALVGYGELPPSQRAVQSFDGAHFVVVAGFTVDGFLVHDPLWPDERGAYRLWSLETMGAALARPGWGNMPMQGMVVQRAYEIVQPEMGELGLAISAAMRETAARHYLEQILGAMGIAESETLPARVGHALAKIVQMEK